MWQQFFVDLAGALIPIIGTGVLALLTACTAYVSAAVKAKFGEQTAAKTAEYIGILEDAAKGAVIAMQQTTVDALKKANAWTPETAADVKAKATAIALASLGDMQAKIQDHLKRDVPAYIEVLIEQALKNLKSSQ